MERSFTVTLTKGAYVVNEVDAERVLEAVERDEAHALVQADTFGDGLHVASVRIVIKHVISVIENPGRPSRPTAVGRSGRVVRLEALPAGAQPKAFS